MSELVIPPSCGVLSRVACVQSVLSPLGLRRALSMLEAYEARRARSFRFSVDRDAYVAAHVLVRQVAAEAIGCSPPTLKLRQQCPDCGGPHGPPKILGYPDVEVSMSHCDSMVAAAAAAKPIAIDVEHLSNFKYQDLRLAHAFTPEERCEIDSLPGHLKDRVGLTLWSRKECLVKLGLLTMSDFSSFNKVRTASGICEFTERWDTRRSTLAVLATLRDPT